MPIGVPKVPLEINKDEIYWVDIYNRLYKERLIFLCQAIFFEIINQIVALLLFLTAEDVNKDFFMFINSPGGSVIAGMALYDTMQLIPSDVYTICLGLAASMGSIILVGGDITKRIALPHARIMIHQPSCSYFRLHATDFILEAEELLSIREILTLIYAQRTGTPLWRLSEDMERDVFMSAIEARAYGIVDLVGLSKDKKK
uniref:ATP-dependent Clp protease proteolytic subunit n=1 Tax=Arachnitis uniflora TaxID=191246 RepID=A0A0K1H2Z0_9LILI|nr:clp protease proteolytic subunit [Arachnitis uniflora]